jgi:Fur family zinc uptake transcriptional regulator
VTEAAALERQNQIAAAEAACRERGETLTPLRRRVFELLLDHDGPAKAYDLLDNLKTPDHGAAKPPTVYRALDFLVRLGLAHRIESQNAFVACDVGACARATIFLICERCGASVEADAGHAISDVNEAARRAGFTLTRTVIEATGVCARCAA